MEKDAEEFEMPEDSGGAAGSREEVRDGLSQGEATGEPLREREDEQHCEDVEEEGRRPEVARTAQRVSKQERLEHDLTHCPFRAWCRRCVRGRGMNMGHYCQHRNEDEERVPRISMDYFFMSKEDETAHKNPLLVMVDEETNDKYARAVGQKGLGQSGEMDWLVRDMSAELKAWGHGGGSSGSIILKSDNENAIAAVRDAVAKLHGGRVIPEGPAKGESQSNGRAEEAGKTVRGFTRM